MKKSKTKKFYEIEKILDKKFDHLLSKFLYEVKWVGYPMDKCTWEPEESLKKAPELLDEFEKLYSQKKTTKNKKKKDKIKSEFDNVCTLDNTIVNEPFKILAKREKNDLIYLLEWEKSKKKPTTLLTNKIMREKYPQHE